MTATPASDQPKISDKETFFLTQISDLLRENTRAIEDALQELGQIREITHVRKCEQMKPKPHLPYAEAAELRTLDVPQWFCKTCGRFWGSDEHMASYCCSVSSECSDCGCVIPKNTCRCDPCYQKEQNKRWSDKPEIEWDGEFPIADWSGDDFYFSLESLCGYLHDYEYEDGETWLDVLKRMKLTTCEPTEPRHFSIADLFEDCLGEDQEPPENRELERQVNDWVKSVSPVAWSMTGKRLGLDRIVETVRIALQQSY